MMMRTPRGSAPRAGRNLCGGRLAGHPISDRNQVASSAMVN